MTITMENVDLPLQSPSFSGFLSPSGKTHSGNECWCTGTGSAPGHRGPARTHVRCPGWWLHWKRGQPGGVWHHKASNPSLGNLVLPLSKELPESKDKTFRKTCISTAFSVSEALLPGLARLPSPRSTPSRRYGPPFGAGETETPKRWPVPSHTPKWQIWD